MSNKKVNNKKDSIKGLCELPILEVLTSPTIYNMDRLRHSVRHCEHATHAWQSLNHHDGSFHDDENEGIMIL